jgi:hypothetical protein
MTVALVDSTKLVVRSIHIKALVRTEEAGIVCTPRLRVLTETWFYRF